MCGIVVDDQQFFLRRFPQECARERSVSGSRCRQTAVVAIIDPEIPFGGVSLIPIHIAMNNAAAELECVLSLRPGVTPERFVMILAGTTTFGTEGAVEFFSQPGSVQEVLRQIPGSASQMKTFRGAGTSENRPRRTAGE
jgi:hypothetical protein